MIPPGLDKLKDLLKPWILSLFGTWTDYSAISTIVGWSSFTTKKIFYRKITGIVFVEFHLEGTSNSATTTFTVPYARHNNGYGLLVPCQIIDNGTAAVGLISLPANSSTAAGYATIAAAAWTASGNKRFAGSFWYQTV